jgi:hypothetical protein
MIFLMSSVRSSLKVAHNLRITQESQRETKATKVKLPPKVANMVFEYILLFICSEQLTAEVLDNILFLDILDIICLDMV